MPSVQILDNANQPESENLGKLVHGLTQGFLERQEKNRNDEIFDRIQKKFGKNATPADMAKEIFKEKGFSESYKSNLLKDIKDYATLSKSEGITPYQQQNLANQRIRLAQDAQKIENASKKNEKDTPKLVAQYTSDLFKNEGTSLPARDKAYVDDSIISYMKQGATLNEAFQEALTDLDIKNEIVQNHKIAEKPTGYFDTEEDVKKNMQQALQDVIALHEAGLEHQSDLRAILKRHKWNTEDINSILSSLYQQKGKKKFENKSPTETSAELNGSQQGVAYDSSGIDDLIGGAGEFADHSYQ